MLETNGLNARFAWQFDLYGGTVLLAATRESDPSGTPDDSVQTLLSGEASFGIRDHVVVGRLEEQADAHARALRSWLVGQRTAGRTVLGYGAASRAVALLCRAEANRQLLPAVVDSSPSKHGRRMPGTDIPIVAPTALATDRPDAVLLFVPDLLPEVRRDFPGIEESGAAWVDADALHA
jgi:hypothetical protein